MKLVWVRQPKGAVPEWKTADGLYSVWLQGRPRHDAPMWAGQYKDTKPWLFTTAPGVGVAKMLCKEHAERMKK